MQRRSLLRAGRLRMPARLGSCHTGAVAAYEVLLVLADGSTRVYQRYAGA